MQRFSCPTCGSEVHFDNTICIACGSQLGFVPDGVRMLAALNSVEPWHNGDHQQLSCVNRQIIGCNWLVADSASSACLSCRHTVIIPDLSFTDNVVRWTKLELAKRTLFYSLLKFRLPLSAREISADLQLRFELKADVLTWDGHGTRVLTGHENGRITINIAEADDDVREKHRIAMGEPYRTLIGHFRHEVGHYYWSRLLGLAGDADEFRFIFGDERDGYDGALGRHYSIGAPSDWPLKYVSAYASSHPWEDFAETWAHYFHMVDGLETAQGYGINGDRARKETPTTDPYREADFSQLIDKWIPLTIAMNAMNRSIGNPDFYPFVLSETILRKLEFIHGLVHGRPEAA